jgi:hypothetical protein
MVGLIYRKTMTDPSTSVVTGDDDWLLVSISHKGVEDLENGLARASFVVRTGEG